MNGTLPTKEVLAVAFDLAAAFERYPLCEWILRNAPCPERARLRLFEILVGDILVGKAEFVRVIDYGAVAVWVSSEVLPLVTAERGRRIYGLLCRELGLKAAKRMLKLYASMVKHHPTKAHDYLFLLGVRPNCRRAGIGTSLIVQHLTRSAQMGRSCYLETSDPTNLAFYARLGFDVSDSYLIDQTSPPTWGMWLGPQA